jgi:hypothetical protein
VTALQDASCASIVSDLTGTATVTVLPRPTAILSSTPKTTCNGTATNLEVSLTGNSPWILTYSGTDGSTLSATINSATSTTYTSGAPYTSTISVSPSTTTTYSLTALTDGSVNNCAAQSNELTGSAVVTVTPRPTATMALPTSVCQGGSANLVFTLTGTPNFSLTYTDGTTPVSISGITTNTYTVSVTPSATTTYSITALNDASCSAIASDITSTATINVVQRPTAVLSGSTTICSGTSTNLNVALTGDQPYTFTYTTNGAGPITISNISTTNYTLTVSPTSTSTYSITALSIGGCSAIPATDITGGPATITVNQTPTATITGTSTICVGSSATINVALTGTAPYSFIYTANGSNPVTVSNIQTNSYSFTVSPTLNTTYSITSVTAAGCTGTGSNIIGSAVITVTKVTASISGDRLICKGGSALLDVVFTGAAPYSFTYTDGTSNTTISNINTTTYQLEVTPPVSRNYSIVSAQGGSCAAANADISGSASVTTRVVTATLSGTTTICSGTSTVISVALTGSSPWIVKYSDGTTVTTVQSIQTSPYTFSVSPSSSKNYTITEVKDTWCKAVSADVTGAANVTVVLSPG